MTWIQTYSGKSFCPTNPDIDAIDIIDISHALAMKCRFSGHCKRFYSVAEHCIRATKLAIEKYPGDHDFHLAVLMHDAAEAYLPDICRPIKHLVYIGDDQFDVVEYKILKCIFNKYNINTYYLNNSTVKWFDNKMLSTEKEHLMNKCNKEWPIGLSPIDNYSFLPMTIDDACNEFLSIFLELLQKKNIDGVSYEKEIKISETEKVT